MSSEDETFVPCFIRFCMTFCKNCDNDYGPRTATSLITVVSISNRMNFVKYSHSLF